MMAVEKVAMMNIVGVIDDVNEVLNELIMMEKVSLVNVLDQVEENGFALNVKEENVEKAVGLSFIGPFPKEKRYEKYLEEIEALKKIFDLDIPMDKKCLLNSYDFDDTGKEIDRIYDEVMDFYKEYTLLKDELNRISQFYKNIMHIKDIDINLDDLKSLKYFSYTFGILNKEERLRIKRNYENILAVILHTGSSDDGEVYLVVYPKELEEETGKILRSVNFVKIDIPDEFTGMPREIITKLEIRRKNIINRITEIEENIKEYKVEYGENLHCYLSRAYMGKKIEEAKDYMACTNNFFYLSGWVAEEDKKDIEATLGKHENLLVTFRDEKEISKVVPPTKLKNNQLFRPFETLVRMYGIPSYRELDPTPFLGLTYMLLFGAMFGDLGQGFILLLAGIFLSRKKGKEVFGQLLSRLGGSSMVFGTLYGAVFGFENIIPALLIRPFENINIILESAVIIGIILILISYMFSILNSIKVKNLEEGLFGRNGVAGLGFYLVLLLLLGGKLSGRTIIPTGIAIVLSVVFIALMVFKEPLANLMLGKRPLYSEDVSSYYIESSFSILETLLAMLSGTVSFIRVGAFALTHVGLFIAFQTIGRLIGTLAGNIVVLIIGNIIIIGLEGLIVFIQGLRLEYYELFSRYYEGEGEEFKTLKIFS